MSTSIFVPKPHSPFQWARQNSAEELSPKHDLLRRGCRRAGVEFSWEDPEHSMLEAIVSRGDRRLGQVIQQAWQLGCKFDAWHEHQDWGRWQQAFQECGLDPGFYAHRERSLFEKFPWSHIDVGVREYIEELVRSGQRLIIFLHTIEIIHGCPEDDRRLLVFREGIGKLH